MAAIPPIVCPVDFSDASRRALETAGALARRLDTALVVLHVYGVRWMPAYAPGAPELPSVALTDDDRVRLREELERHVAAIGVPGTRTTLVLREGAVVEEILAATSDARTAALLVIGSHGRTGVRRLVLGSVAERVLRGARGPVLTVPAGTERPPDATQGFRRPLAAIDFSPASRAALDAALPLLGPGAQVSLLHVMELLPDLPDLGHETTAGGPQSLDEYIEAYQQDSRARLDDVAAAVRQAGVTVTTGVGRGRAHAEILRAGEEGRHDLLILGTHGGGLVDRLFVGSTAQQVVRQAHHPVLTLRA